MAVDRVASGLAPQISGAIRQAAQSTGISFQYLLTTAQIESNLNPSAQASTSSAKGLYQFIDQTWLGTVKQSGAAYGMGQYADAITQTGDGQYQVADPSMRSAIMKLRTDPAASAMMAGVLARNNAEQLSATIGRAPTEGELYTAHFLGPDGAGRLINAAATTPDANAASMFPAAASANRPIFYHRDGTPKSVANVYDRLTGKFDTARVAVMRPPGDIPNVTNISVTGSVVPVTVASLGAPVPGALRSLSSPAPDTAGVTQALASADNRPPPNIARPMFQDMFSDPTRGAVARTVASLWTDTSQTGGSSQTASAPAAIPAAANSAGAGPVRPLELFTDRAANVRGMFTGRG
ncbi:MAG: transglycosylase SLT domain-containing protein [Proteobacteria bacterium]|nr:transglycosylase SLT domain-containing protein [Pseudomonadota bacterium]